MCCSLQETYEAKRTEHLKELQKKEEEMRQMFVVRVKEKEAELKEAEKEVRKRQICVWLLDKVDTKLIRSNITLVLYTSLLAQHCSGKQCSITCANNTIFIFTKPLGTPHYIVLFLVQV